MWSMLLDRFTDLVFQLLFLWWRFAPWLLTAWGGFDVQTHGAPARIYETNLTATKMVDEREFKAWFCCWSVCSPCSLVWWGLHVMRRCVMLQSRRARLTWLCGLKFKSKTRIVWARLVNRYPNDSLIPFRFIHPLKQQILHYSVFVVVLILKWMIFLFCRCLNGMIATFGFSSMRMLRPSCAIG